VRNECGTARGGSGGIPISAVLGEGLTKLGRTLRLVWLVPRGAIGDDYLSRFHTDLLTIRSVPRDEESVARRCRSLSTRARSLRREGCWRRVLVVRGRGNNP
jgi:hypothetical protein